MAKSYKFNPDQAIDQRNKSKAIKQGATDVAKVLGRKNKEFLKGLYL